jgi:predicted PurR-regulated permease PerM
MPALVTRYIKIGLLLLLVCAAVAFLYEIGDLVKLFIVSAMLAYVLDPVATDLESRGMSRFAATGIIFLFIGVIIAVIVVIAIPAFVREIQTLQSSASANQTKEVIINLQRVLEEKFSFLGVHNLHLEEKIQAWKLQFSQDMLDYLLDHAVKLITHLVAVPFIIFFLLKDGREMKRQLIRLVPNRYYEFALNLLNKMDLQLGLYLRGQVLDAAIFGLLSTGAMWILDVKYFAFVGAFAGVANIIPYVGPIAGAALATGITILNTPDLSRVAYVLLAFCVVKLMDDSIIQPLAVAKSVDMHPLLVLVAVIVGGQFFGILGMLISVPVVGFFKVGIKESAIMLRRYKLS